MVNQNTDSLRTQIIEAMNNYNGNLNAGMFDNAIMPVLDAAMKAGELLLHRATTPQKPVAEAIIEWLERCDMSIAYLHQIESTVSKRELLNALYCLEDGIARALADARAITPETTSNAFGGVLAGKSFPAKG